MSKKPLGRGGYAKMRASGKVPVMLTVGPREKKLWQTLAQMDGRSLCNWIRRVVSMHIETNGFLAGDVLDKGSTKK